MSSPSGVWDTAPQTNFWYTQNSENASHSCKRRSISAEQNLKIEANVIVSRAGTDHPEARAPVGGGLTGVKGRAPSRCVKRVPLVVWKLSEDSCRSGGGAPSGLRRHCR